jgi:hypothetical protein
MVHILRLRSYFAARPRFSMNKVLEIKLGRVSTKNRCIPQRAGLAAALAAMYSRVLKPGPEDSGVNSGWVAHVASTASTTEMVDRNWLRTG